MLAREAARLSGHHHVGTEHLLLGCAQETQGMGMRALAQLGVSAEALRSATERHLPPGEARTPESIPFTRPARAVLDHAAAAAERLGNAYVGTEHLLMGLLAERAGGASRVLEELGVDRDRFEAAVTGIVGGRQEPPDDSGIHRIEPDG